MYVGPKQLARRGAEYLRLLQFGFVIAGNATPCFALDMGIGVRMGFDIASDTSYPGNKSATQNNTPGDGYPHTLFLMYTGRIKWTTCDK